MCAGFFIGAIEQALSFLAGVGTSFIVINLWQFEVQAFDLRHGVGNQIVMLDWHQWQFDAGQRRYFAPPQAGRIDHIFRMNCAVFGHHIPATIGALGGCKHRCLTIDIGTELARRGGECLGG